MIEKTTSNTSLGLELTPSELRGAYLIYKQNKAFLERTFQIPIDPEHSHPVKLLYKENEDKEFIALSNKSLPVSAVPSTEVLIRDLELLLTKEKDIDQVLEFQTEPLLPYSIDEAIFDRIVLKKTSERTFLTIASVKKERLHSHLEEWHDLGIEPEIISCVPAALAAFSEQFIHSEEPNFVLHLGEFESTCCLVEKGALISAQTYKLGTHHLKTAYKSSKNFYSLDFSQITAEAEPSLHEALQLYKQETTKVLFYLTKNAYKKEITDILITGEGASFKNLGQILCTDLKKNLCTPEPSSQFPLSTEELALFAIPIGSALTALPKALHQINLRQNEFTYPNPWKRLKKPLALYLTLSVVLSMAIYLFSYAYIGTKEDNLKKSYLNLLVLMKKPFDEFEQEIQKKEPATRTFHDQKEITPSSLTQNDLRKRLTLIEKEIRGSPDVFPLFPDIPKVSDVLGWLSSHPHIKGEEGTESPRIQLESFGYKMIKRPEANKMREKYQVKVDIEFTAQTPRYAREFHDILLAPNEIIDSKSDINWSTERGKYRASFFLKDKTLYPAVKSSP